MTIEERVEIAVLSKYYGKMLTEKQLAILSMYVDNNLSLAEVSEELKISRQAVKDALDKALETLKTAEQNFGFVNRDKKLKEFIEKTPNKNIDEKTKSKLLALLED